MIAECALAMVRHSSMVTAGRRTIIQDGSIDDNCEKLKIMADLVVRGGGRYFNVYSFSVNHYAQPVCAAFIMADIKSSSASIWNMSFAELTP